MIDTYFPVLVMILLSFGFVITMLCLSIFIGPKKYSEKKDDPFECGTVGTGDTKQRFSVKFYMVAMLFILFDVEIVFMYPWAVQVVELGWPAFWAMMSFMFVLTVGLIYIIKRKVLDWA